MASLVLSTSLSLLLQVLLQQQAGAEARGTRPTEVVIGALFPFIEDGYLYSIGCEIAQENMVNRTELEPLPWFNANKDVKLTYSYADSEGNERGAFEAALQMTMAKAPRFFVGPSFSSESVVVSLLSNVFKFAVLSYSATSPRLSEKNTFPNFYRNVPSDNAQGSALVDFVADKLLQQKIIVIHTDESYGLGLLNSFRERAASKNLTIPLVITLPAAFDDVALIRERMAFALPLVYANNTILDVGTFLLLVASPDKFATVLSVAEDYKLVGDPFIWITTDGGSTLDISDESVATNITRANRVGIFGTQLAAASNAKFETNLNARYQELRTAGKKVPVYGEETALPEVISVYAAYVYDACVIAARTLDTLYSRELYNFTIGELNDVLKNSSYDGTSGLNQFDQFQDRDAVYDILNTYDGKWNKIFSYAENAVRPGGTGQPIFSGNKKTPPVFKLPPVPLPPPEPFNGGYIAAIVLGIFVVLVALVAVAVYFLLKKREASRIANEQAQNAAPLFWSSADEVEEISVVEAKHDMDSQLVVVTASPEQRALYEVDRDANIPLFGVARGTRCNVNEELLDTITLVNHSAKPVQYSITVPTSGEECAFELTAKPGVGTLKAGERRIVNLTFKLLFTTKVNRWVKVVFGDADAESQGASYVALRVEGVVSARIDPMELELYGKPIGEGAFGVVYRGKYRGTLVAAKVPRKQGEMRDSQLKAFQDEIALFEKLRSPYIVNFIGASHVPGRLCICTELLERGTVFELIHKAKVSNVLKVKILIDAANALAYLHKNGVLYRDMKPDNLLVSSVSHTAAVNVRLSDFGTAVSVQDPTAPIAHTGSIGTPAYMAPEIMANQPYNCKADVYSLGMLSWEVFAEAVPFSFLKRVWDLPRLVLDGMRPELPNDWPKGVRDAISDCWLQAPEKRPMAENVASTLEKVFQPLKKEYESARKSKAVVENEDGAVPSKSRTAGTGQLDRIIEMGAGTVGVELPTGEGKVRKAADLRSTVDTEESTASAGGKSEEKEKKKKKKKVVVKPDADEEE